MNPHDVEDLYPLSPQQQGMLFGTLFATEGGVYVEQEISTISPGLDVAAFHDAWGRVLSRHAALRTAFVWREQDEPLQAVLRHVQVPLHQEDWRGSPPDLRRERLREHLAADRRRGFDLSRAPLMRLALFQTDDGHEFVWTTHHIVMDGWCLPRIVREFGEIYAALCRRQEPMLEPAPPYREYINWLERQDLGDARSFWGDYLAGLTRPTPLGRERSEPAATAPETGHASLEGQLDSDTTAALKRWARSRRLTMGTLLHGAWALVLGRYSGDRDVVFGSTVSGRPPDLPGSEAIIGLFINTLPFRAQLDGEGGLAGWLAGIQKTHLELRRFEHCSTGQIHQWSGVPGWSQLYDSVVVFENYPIDRSAEPDAAGAAKGSFAGAQTGHALTILLVDARELHVRIVHDRRRVDGDAASKVLAHLVRVLVEIAAEPDRPLAAIAATIPPEEIPYVSAAPMPAPATSDTYVAPRTDIEQLLSEMWTDVLGLERIGIHDNFFGIGGHSLIAMQFMGRLRASLELDLPLRVLFESGTIAELAVLVEERLLEEIEALPDEQVERLLRSTG